MKIIYKDKKVERLCNDEDYANKYIGKDVTNKLMKVIYLLKSVYSLFDIYVYKSLNLHKLKGDLKDLYSIYLGKNTGYRLLIKPINDELEIMIIKDIKEFREVKNVEIMEVSKHYE
jgi:proteic killer suppression protein